jgi:hypothetical protein
MSPHIFFSNPPSFSVEWGTIPHNFEILDGTLIIDKMILCMID